MHMEGGIQLTKVVDSLHKDGLNDSLVDELLMHLVRAVEHEL